MKNGLTPICDLDMTTRLWNILKNQNIVHLEELANIYSQEMKEWPSCGYSTLKEAAALMAKHGLQFKDKPIFNTPEDFNVSQKNIEFLRIVADIIERQKLEIIELKKKLETYKHSEHLQNTVDNLTEQLHKLRTGQYKYRGGVKVYTEGRNSEIYEAVEAGELQQIVGDRYGITKSAVNHIHKREKKRRADALSGWDNA